MKRIVLILFFCGITIIAKSQDKELSVKKSTSQAGVLGFNPTVLTLQKGLENIDFSFFKNELKGVQIVMLGENTHFDGNIFELKTKIVKYLHQEMNFNIIAFESGVYDIWKAQKEIEKGIDIKEALGNSLFSIWTDTREFQSFIEYYDKHKKELKLVGFDNQMTGKYGDEELLPDLFQYCIDNKIEIKLDLGDLELLFESIHKSRIFDENDITFKQFKSALNRIKDEIAKKPNSENKFYWTQIVKNLLSIGEYYYQKKYISNTFKTTSQDNIRDKQMADNLLAYLKTHPGEKIICWGANQHFTNDMTSINEPVLKDFIPMGSYIKSALKDKVYSLATVTASDSIKIPGTKWEKTKVIPKSFEFFLREKKKPFLFISSKQNEMKIKKSTRIFSFVTFVEARLDLIFDGYLYLDKTAPATYIERDEELDPESNNSNQDRSNKTQATEIVSSQDENNVRTYNLEEVVIYAKKSPYSIIKKAIKNISKNYPVDKFNSTLASNIDVEMNDTTVFNIDFIASQYDLGYDQKGRRNMKQIKEIRWNTKNDYDPKSLRYEFFDYYRGNPIMYGGYLNKRKFKKFVFKQLEDKKYNNKDIYVINFSTLRNHYNYTHREYFCNYSGTLYINKDDFAVVKIIENWEVTKYPEDTYLERELLGWPKKFIKREDTFDTGVTSFIKINDKYYIDFVQHKVKGNLFDKENHISQFTININSCWSNFDSSNPIPIKYKQEITRFDKVKFDKSFWETYKIPKINN